MKFAARRIMTKLLVVALAATLSACALHPGPVPAMDTVAIVSVTGDRAQHFVHDPVTLKTSSVLLPVPAWRVDEHVETRAAVALQVHGSSPVDEPSPAQARAWVGTATFDDSTGRPAWHFPAGPDGLHRAAEAAGARWLVVVAPAPPVREDPFLHTSSYVTGYGLYTRGKDAVDVAQLAVLLVDGRTGEVVKWKVGDGEAPRASGAAGLSREGTLAAIDQSLEHGLRALRIE